MCPLHFEYMKFKWDMCRILSVEHSSYKTIDSKFLTDIFMTKHGHLYRCFLFCFIDLWHRCEVAPPCTRKKYEFVRTLKKKSHLYTCSL